MKLLMCKKCMDIFSLTLVNKSCQCTKDHTRGRYLNDLEAIYTGINATPIGFINFSLGKALQNQPEIGDGYEFKAFIIPKRCDTFTKITEQTKLNFYNL